MTHLTTRRASLGTRKRLEDRIAASLANAMMGDALGAPTEQRSIEEIRDLFGGRVDQFYRPPADALFSKGREAGQFTDDSSQMLLLAQKLIDRDGEITARDVGDMLIEWSGMPQYYPHFAGPSTRRAIDAIKNGADPNETGKQPGETTQGTSNGGAMRVAPAGLVNPGDPASAVDTAAITCRPSHFTNIGVASAGAIASAVSVALTEHVTVNDIVRAAIRGAERGASIGSTEGRHVAGPSVARRIGVAARLGIAASSFDQAVRDIADIVGSGLPAAEAVPAAIGLFVAAAGDPWLTIVGAANIGDDTDTIGCMAGAIAGAYRGMSALDDDRVAMVLAANDVALPDLAAGLADVAWRRAGRV